MGPEDERAFLREIAPLGLLLYPEAVPPDWEAPVVDEELADQLVEPAYYLGIPDAGRIDVDKIKRGPNKGKWTILEVTSPVIHLQRSLLEDGESVLRGGRIWAELQISGDTERRVQKTPVVEGVFRRVSEAITRNARRSQPVGHFILPHACRLHEAGVELREPGRKGGVVRPFR